MWTVWFSAAGPWAARAASRRRTTTTTTTCGTATCTPRSRCTSSTTCLPVTARAHTHTHILLPLFTHKIRMRWQRYLDSVVTWNGYSRIGEVKMPFNITTWFLFCSFNKRILKWNNIVITQICYIKIYDGKAIYHKMVFLLLFSYFWLFVR